MRQLDFFDPPAARTQTSAAAAAAVRAGAGNLPARVLQFFRDCGPAGATDHEIALTLALHPDTARAQRVELRDLGCVRDSGTTRPSPSGRQAIVWLLAIAGVVGDDRRGPVARPALADRAGDVADQAGPDGLFPHAPDDVRLARWEDCRPWPIRPPADPGGRVK